MSAPVPAPPRWIGVQGLAVLTVASLVSCGVGLVMCGGAFGFLTTLSSTAIAGVVGATVARRVLDGPDDGPYRRSLLAGLVAGPIGTMLLFTSFMVFTPNERVRPEIIVIFGGILGLFLGPLFALVTIPITSVARDWRKATALDTFEHALASYGLVLLLFGSFVALIQASGGERGWDGELACAIATVFFATVVMRDRARRRWLAKVLANDLPGWTVIEATEPDALPPFVRATQGEKVLAHASAGDGPFRGGGATTLKVARLDPGATMRKLSKRALLSCVGVVAALALQPALVALRLDTIAHDWLRVPMTPTRVEGLDASKVTEIAASDQGACVHVSDGTLRCWGNGAGPLLATATSRDRPSRRPEARSGLGPFETMALANGRVCVLRKAGESRALCWGEASEGQLGDAKPGRKSTPIELGPPGVTALALSDRSTLALTTTGEVHSWGIEMIDPPETSIVQDAEIAPRKVAGLSNIVQIAAAGSHACAIDRAGSVYCWGDDGYSQTTGDRRDNRGHAPPTRIASLPGRATALALTSDASWARIVDADGRATWWGWGQPSIWSPDGTGTHEAAREPRLVAGMEPFKQVRLSYGHACGLAENGSVHCWHPDLKSDQVLPPGSAVELAGDSDMQCARGRTAVWCWALR